MATLYACYHGPKQLRANAERVNRLANTLMQGCQALGLKTNQLVFDTVTLYQVDASDLVSQCLSKGYNVNQRSDSSISIALDETCDANTVLEILQCLGANITSIDLAEVIDSQWLRSDSLSLIHI